MASRWTSRPLHLGLVLTYLLVVGHPSKSCAQRLDVRNGTECSAGCKHCSSGSHCLECKATHQRSGYQCFKTGDPEGCSDENCHDCSERFEGSERTICYKCREGYAIRDPTGLCKWVGPRGCEDPKCSSCSTRKEVCEECKPGYQLRGGECQKAGSKRGCSDRKCIECSDDGVECLICRDDFQVRLGTCLSLGCLDQNCVSCSPSGGTCRRCKDGFRVNDKGACLECSDNCLECTVNKLQGVQQRANFQNGGPTEIEVCDKCAPGFSTSPRGICKSCNATTSDCQLCSDDGQICYGCNSGFYLEEGNCIACPENCESCKSPWYCDKALPTFTLSGPRSIVDDPAASSTKRQHFNLALAVFLVSTVLGFFMHGH